MFQKIYSLFHHHYHLKYHGVYRHAKKLFVFDLALLALAIAMFGASVFFFLWKPGISDKIDLAISLGGGRILSGQEVSISIKYTNRNSQTLAEPVLGVRLPNGFIIDRAKTPESEFSDQHIFQFKNIPAGASGEVKIYGRLWTDLTAKENIDAFLTYRPDKVDYREQKTSQFLLQLPASVLKIDLEMPAQTFGGTVLPIKYSIKNTGTEPIKNIKVIFTGLRNQTADMAEINVDETKTININAPMPADTGEYNLKITTQTRINGTWLTQDIIEKKVKTVSPAVWSEAKINSSASYAEPGQTLPVEISWKNNSEFTLYNPRVRLAFTPGIVDAAATARANGFRVSGNDVVIDKMRRTALYNGAPGSSDSFKLNLILAKHFELGNKEKTRLEITPVVEAEVASVPGQTLKISGINAALPIATEASLSAKALYYTAEGDQLGRGPLPPKAGETTKYWIFVEIYNTTNGLANTVFTTVLPAGIEFTGRQSVTIGPGLAYSNTAHGTVSWNYNFLPPNSRTGLYFEVAITPGGVNIGAPMQLTETMRLTTTDDWTGKKFNLTLPGVNNVLGADDRGKALGAVVE
ncbi:MAG: CARDB domain-containing protein [bacterium]|nr:CARDB domain-containing protein [bacterium]